MATIEESLRITSIFPIITRKSTKDSTLEGYHVPKDTTIFINVWALHFDEKEWENPDVFNPERFLDSDGRLIQLADMKSLYPFGAGRRVCIGESLARQELFLIITRLLHQFTIETEGPDCLPSLDRDLSGLIIYPKPFKVCFKNRYQ